MRIGLVQLLIIFAIVVFFIGPTQIPKLAKALKSSKDELLEDKSKEETPVVSQTESAADEK
mgnify:CR=1 FL=1